MSSNQQQLFIKNKDADLVQKTVDGLKSANLEFSKQQTFKNGIDTRGDVMDGQGRTYIDHSAGTIPGRRVDIEVSTVSDLKSLEPEPTQTVLVKGYNSEADGGGGLFWWDGGADAANANGGTTIASTVSGYTDGDASEGVWRSKRTDINDCRAWGVVPNDDSSSAASVNRSALQQQIDHFAANGGGEVFLRGGDIWIDDVVELKPLVQLHCSGDTQLMPFGQHDIFSIHQESVVQSLRINARDINHDWESSALVLDAENFPNSIKRPTFLSNINLEGRYPGPNTPNPDPTVGTAIKLVADKNKSNDYILNVSFDQVGIRGFTHGIYFKTIGTNSPFLNSIFFDNVWIDEVVNPLTLDADSGAEISQNKFTNTDIQSKPYSEYGIKMKGPCRGNTIQGTVWDFAANEKNEVNNGIILGSETEGNFIRTGINEDFIQDVGRQNQFDLNFDQQKTIDYGYRPNASHSTISAAFSGEERDILQGRSNDPNYTIDGPTPSIGSLDALFDPKFATSARYNTSFSYPIYLRVNLAQVVRARVIAVKYNYGDATSLFNIGVEEDNNRSSGSSTSVSTGKLIDSSASFNTQFFRFNGDMVRNDDDNTYARILGVDSDTQLDLDSDIFTSTGKNYTLFKTITREREFGSGDRIADVGASHVRDRWKTDRFIIKLGAPTNGSVQRLNQICVLSLSQRSNYLSRGGGDMWGDLKRDGKQILTTRQSAVGELTQSISSPPTQTEVQNIQDKVNTIIDRLGITSGHGLTSD